MQAAAVGERPSAAHIHGDLYRGQYLRTCLTAGSDDAGSSSVSLDGRTCLDFLRSLEMELHHANSALFGCILRLVWRAVIRNPGSRRSESCCERV